MNLKNRRNIERIVVGAFFGGVSGFAYGFRAGLLTLSAAVYSTVIMEALDQRRERKAAASAAAAALTTGPAKGGN